MGLVSVLLVIFVVLGLARDRLGKSTYIYMAILVLFYVAYAYNTNQ
jgi:hypothetical protein